MKFRLATTGYLFLGICLLSTLSFGVDSSKKNKSLYISWSGSNYGYHYLGSAITFSKIGRAFGQATLELLIDKQ